MKQRLLKRIGIGLSIAITLLALVVVAFVFNPLEGSLRDIRDVVPRQVDFFLRKTGLAGDFSDFPEPVFWADFADSQAFQDLSNGPLAADLRRQGIERSLAEIRDASLRIREESGGWLDLLRDLIGTEVIVAGYFEDPVQRRPLPEPGWCLYARASWRIRAVWGLLQWSIVRSKAREGGLDIQEQDGVLVIKPQGTGETLYASRNLDCLMLANDRRLLEQSIALGAGMQDEQPLGMSARYADGISNPLRAWVRTVQADEVDALEFSITPNSIASFKQFASRWPDANSPDSIYERVLASFVNLKCWNSISGAAMFEPDKLSFLGEVVLNSNMLTPFQRNFFRTEAQERSRWLDPFLNLVPESACAAAALRMPAGEFIDAMFQALAPNDKELLNDAVRHAPWGGQQLADARDVIDRLKTSLLPRTGFVFRKNVQDPEISVANPTPVPQVAWVFWIREGGAAVLQQAVQWMRRNAQTLGFKKVYLLKLNLSGTQSSVSEDTGSGDVVWEFTNPQIDGTGEIAALQFKDFFVLSNSGPLIKDMFWARYGVLGRRSISDTPEMREFEIELPNALNGLIYLHGPQLAELFSEFRTYAEKSAEDPDPVWMRSMRQQAEAEVWRARFPNYPSIASIPESARQEFEELVSRWLHQQWKLAKSGLTGEDLGKLEQFKALAGTFKAAYVQLDLENNYMRFLGKILAGYR
ncbi:MAG: hypothetical protein Fur0037_14410 [Planctomycetota bacterium]